MSQNYTLIGCLAKTCQDQHLKLRTQSHILFLCPFLTIHMVIIPSQISIALIFILIPPFQNLEMKVVLQAERGGCLIL